MIYSKTLKSGLKLIVDKMSGFSVSMGIMVGVGSSNENAKNNGISHFIEHTTFKGTPKRTAFQINEDADFLGSRLNAYTSKDSTMYHIKATLDKVDDSFEILADMFVNANYEQEELDKEKGVVNEEIAMAEDTPDDICFDQLSQAFFGNHGYGQRILGTKDNINSFTKQNILDFRKDWYTSDNIVVVFVGNITLFHAEKLVNKYIEGKLYTKSNIITPTSNIIYDKNFTNKKIEQAHFAMAYKGLSFNDDKKVLLQLASLILGGGMSSRLFNKIREEQGLCYTIYAYTSSYKDTGSLTVYSAVNPKMASHAIDSVLKEIEKFKKDGITKTEFEKSKNQYLSSIIMSQESNSSLMSVFAKYYMFTGEIYDYKKHIDKIININYDKLQSFIKEEIELNDFAFSLVSQDLDLSVLN